MHVEWRRRIQIVGIVTGVYLGTRYLLPVVIPFFVGWLLAMWLYPKARWAEKRLRVHRVFSGTVMIGGIVGVVLLLVWNLAEIGVEQLRLAISGYGAFENRIEEMIRQGCGVLEDMTGIPQIQSHTFFSGQLREFGTTLKGTFNQDLLWRVVDCFKYIVWLVSGVMIAVISGILFLKDMEKIKKQAREYTAFRGIGRIAGRLKKTVITYFKAQAVIVILVGTVCSVGFWLMGNPYYLLIGILIGCLDVLPLIGTGTFLYPAAVIFLIQGNAAAAGGCVVLDLLTSGIREFLEPKLLGEKLGIYPVIILAAVYFGIILYGPWGFLVGPLSFAVMYETGKEWDVWD